MIKTIRGKIIRLVDKETLIVNLGVREGITDESIFRILADPEPIIDPETKEELGKVNIVKGRIKTSLVEDKFTIATTKWVAPFSGVSNVMDAVALFGRGQEVVREDLYINDGDLNPWRAKSEHPVRVGDAVETSIYLIPPGEPISMFLHRIGVRILKENPDRYESFSIGSKNNKHFRISFRTLNKSNLVAEGVYEDGQGFDTIRELIEKQLKEQIEGKVNLPQF